MVTVISRLLPFIAKLQLQSDRTTEMFVSFQNYCAAIFGDHVYQGEMLADFFICDVIKCVKFWFCATYKLHNNLNHVHILKVKNVMVSTYLDWLIIQRKFILPGRKRDLPNSFTKQNKSKNMPSHAVMPVVI